MQIQKLKKTNYVSSNTAKPLYSVTFSLHPKVFIKVKYHKYFYHARLVKKIVVK